MIKNNSLIFFYDGLLVDRILIYLKNNYDIYEEEIHFENVGLDGKKTTGLRTFHYKKGTDPIMGGLNEISLIEIRENINTSIDDDTLNIIVGEALDKFY
jgi:hypothetical protein